MQNYEFQFNFNSSNYTILFVRLGDQNIQNRNDGVTEIDIGIAAFTEHEAYDKETKQNDIALIKLARSVKFTNTIRPACLHQTKSILEPKALATGWGHTGTIGGETSSELMKVQLDIMDLAPCVRANQVGRIIINDNQVCAGVLRGGHDTCLGGELFKI